MEPPEVQSRSQGGTAEAHGRVRLDDEIADQQKWDEGATDADRRLITGNDDGWRRRMMDGRRTSVGLSMAHADSSTAVSTAKPNEMDLITENDNRPP